MTLGELLRALEEVGRRPVQLTLHLLLESQLDLLLPRGLLGLVAPCGIGRLELQRAQQLGAQHAIGHRLVDVVGTFARLLAPLGQEGVDLALTLHIRKRLTRDEDCPLVLAEADALLLLQDVRTLAVHSLVCRALRFEQRVELGHQLRLCLLPSRELLRHALLFGGLLGREALLFEALLLCDACEFRLLRRLLLLLR